MKIVDTDRTVTMIIMVTIMVTKITIDMEMAQTTPGDMSSQMEDTKINERPTTKTLIRIII